MRIKELNQKVYDKFYIFAGSLVGLILLGLWSFFEASVWFIAPDFLIMLFSLVLFKKYKKFILVALITSLIGGLLYYILNLFYFEQLTDILFNTPFVAERSVAFVSKLLSEYGVIATFLQSITLIPFKIWTHFIVQYNLSPLLYFVFVAISRTIRFFVVAFVFAFLGKKFKNKIRNNFNWLLIIYLLSFALVMFLLEA